MEPLDGEELSRVTLDGDLVRLKWAEGVHISEEAARTAMARVNEVCGDGRFPMLVDMTRTKSVARSARTVFALPCAANRIALLGKSPVDRVIANFILGVSDLPTPTKFFNTEVLALAWLEDVSDAGQQ